MSGKLQTIVFLVRHGETDKYYSAERSIDSERQLTLRGRKQAETVGEYLSQFAPTAIYSSPLDRCKDTAELIASKQDENIRVETTDSLVEVYSDVPSVRKEVGERGETIFQTILSQHKGEQVVAVTHQYIIGYIVAEFLNVGYHDVECDFADVYRLVFAEQKLVEAVHLRPAGKI